MMDTQGILNAYVVGVRVGFHTMRDWPTLKPSNPYRFIDTPELYLAWLDGFILGMRMALAEGR